MFYVQSDNVQRRRVSQLVYKLIYILIVSRRFRRTVNFEYIILLWKRAATEIESRQT